MSTVNRLVGVCTLSADVQCPGTHHHRPASVSYERCAKELVVINLSKLTGKETEAQTNTNGGDHIGMRECGRSQLTHPSPLGCTN